MKTVFYSTKSHEIEALKLANRGRHELIFLSDQLNASTVHLAQHCDAVCCFVTDVLNAAVLEKLSALGIKMIALRSAGYDHLDVKTAKQLGLIIARVPEYSPEAVAEFATTLLLALTRKLPQALQKVARHDFTFTDLMGVNLHQKTVGIVGAGHIGTAFARIMVGFCCRVLIDDPAPSAACLALPIEVVSREKILAESDVVSLHCPLTSDTLHWVNANSIAHMKKGVILINTGRGALVDTAALIDGLQSHHIGAAGLDVYERETGLFFEDHSKEKLQDELFLKLALSPNVLITNHIAFFSEEAVANIARITIENLTAAKSNI